MNPTPTITVTGAAATSAIPDAMGISLTVHAHHEHGVESLARASASAREVIAAILEVAPNASLATTGITLAPRTNWRNDESVMIGYDAQTTLAATGLAVDAVGLVLLAAVDAGGDSLRIDSLRADLTDPSLALEKARELAYADALAKAGHLALLASVRLGAPLRIREFPEAPPPHFKRVTESPMAAKSMPVVAGSRELAVALEVQWELVADAQEPDAGTG